MFLIIVVLDRISQRLQEETCNKKAKNREGDIISCSHPTYSRGKCILHDPESSELDVNIYLKLVSQNNEYIRIVGLNRPNLNIQLYIYNKDLELDFVNCQFGSIHINTNQIDEGFKEDFKEEDCCKLGSINLEETDCSLYVRDADIGGLYIKYSCVKTFNLENIKSKELNITESNLENPVELFSCTFSGLELQKFSFPDGSVLNDVKIGLNQVTDVDFSNCNIYDCDLRNCIFSYCNFKNTSLYQSDLRGSNIHNSNIEKALIDDTTKFLGGPELDPNEIKLKKFIPFSRSRNRFDPDTSNDTYHYYSPPKEHQARSQYINLEKLGRNCSNWELEKKAFVRRKDVEYISYKRSINMGNSFPEFIYNSLNLIRLFILCKTTLYGRSVSRSLLSCFITILVFSMIYTEPADSALLYIEEMGITLVSIQGLTSSIKYFLMLSVENLSLIPFMEFIIGKAFLGIIIFIITRKLQY